MDAVVTYPFTDKGSGAVRYVGERIELAEERFIELSRAGFVAVAEPEDQPEGEDEPEELTEDQPEGEDEPEELTEDQPEGEDESEELTVAQLREQIVAKGGFAPKRATKAQLNDILGTL